MDRLQYIHRLSGVQGFIVSEHRSILFLILDPQLEGQTTKQDVRRLS